MLPHPEMQLGWEQTAASSNFDAREHCKGEKGVLLIGKKKKKSKEN